MNSESREETVASAPQAPKEPAPAEQQLKHWERVAWMIALIAGIHTAYTTWMSGIQYMNARRDIILGIGQSKPLPPDLAYLVFKNDWLTCAFGFFCHAAIAFGILWLLLVHYRPVQDAVLNPFGVKDADDTLERRRRSLRLVVNAGVGGGLTLLAITLVTDGLDTWSLMKKYCVDAPSTGAM